MVSEANIWFSHFKLNVLGGDMVSFTGACPISAREGDAKNWLLKPFRTVTKSIFPKRGFVWKWYEFPEFQATSLHVFNHCEATRHDEITNEPILES